MGASKGESQASAPPLEFCKISKFEKGNMKIKR
jgi:hypothetical protein